MLPAPFEYHRPSSLDEAVQLLSGLDEAKVLAGGQSLIPLLKFRFAAPAHLIDVNRVPGLDGIREDGGSLRIGALVRHNQMAGSDLISARYPTLAAAAHEILTEVHVPAPDPRTGGAYLKLERKVGDFATVAAAVHVSMEDGTIGRAGIGLTAVGTKNVQPADAESALAGKEPSEELFAEAGRLAAAACNPVADVRGSAEYKRHVVEVFVRRGLARAVEMARAA